MVWDAPGPPPPRSGFRAALARVPPRGSRPLAIVRRPSGAKIAPRVPGPIVVIRSSISPGGAAASSRRASAPGFGGPGALPRASRGAGPNPGPTVTRSYISAPEGRQPIASGRQPLVSAGRDATSGSARRTPPCRGPSSRPIDSRRRGSKIERIHLLTTATIDSMPSASSSPKRCRIRSFNSSWARPEPTSPFR